MQPTGAINKTIDRMGIGLPNTPKDPKGKNVCRHNAIHVHSKVDCMAILDHCLCNQHNGVVQ